MSQKLSEAASRPFHEMIRDQAPAPPPVTETHEQSQPFNIVSVIVAAAVAAAAAAGVWAAITVATGIQIGWMAVGVGFLVGLAVRVVGASDNILLGYIGAFFAFLGCLAGNLLAVCGMVASEEGIAWTEVLAQLDLTTANTLMILSFQPIDLLFYGMALYFGYKLSLDTD